MALLSHEMVLLFFCLTIVCFVFFCYIQKHSRAGECFCFLFESDLTPGC